MEDVSNNILMSTEIMEERGSGGSFSWHDRAGKGIEHDIKSRYDLIKSLNRRRCRTS